MWNYFKKRWVYFLISIGVFQLLSPLVVAAIQKGDISLVLGRILIFAVSPVVAILAGFCWFYFGGDLCSGSDSLAKDKDTKEKKETKSDFPEIWFPVEKEKEEKKETKNPFEGIWKEKKLTGETR